jgi:hypothetical protein
MGRLGKSLSKKKKRGTDFTVPLYFLREPDILGKIYKIYAFLGKPQGDLVSG